MSAAHTPVYRARICIGNTACGRKQWMRFETFADACAWSMDFLARTGCALAVETIRPSRAALTAAGVTP